MVDEASWRRVVAVVQRIEAQNFESGIGKRTIQPREGENFIRGSAAAAVTSIGATGTFTPDTPGGASDLDYISDTFYVASGAEFPLVYNQRYGRFEIPIVQEILEVALTGTLSNNSSASATITKCDGTAGDTITVYDNGKIGAGYHFASGGKLSVYYSLCGKYYWLAGPCRVAD